MLSFARRNAATLGVIAVGLIPVIALGFGLIGAANTPQESGSTNLAPTPALITITLLITILTAIYPAWGVLRRLLTAVILGGLAGVSLVLGDYLAFLARLGHYAGRGDWSGEEGRWLTGFIILFTILGGLIGGICGVVGVFLSLVRRPPGT